MNADHIKKKVYQLPMEEKHRLMERLAAFMTNRAEIVFAYVHGSFTEDLPCHDIDIGAYVSNISREAASSHALELSSLLSGVLKMRADVRVINFAPICGVASLSVRVSILKPEKYHS